MIRMTSTSDGRGPALSALIAHWANAHPAILRVWLFAGPDEDASTNGPIDVALELQPVGDSEESAASWLGNCERWRRQLEAQTGRGVELEWLDVDEGARRAQAGEGRLLIFERAG